MSGAGGPEGDDIIRDSREVLVLAREFFGSGGNLPNDKPNGGK